MPPLNLLGKISQGEDLMSQSANSQRQNKPAASKASSDELPIQYVLPASSRKRSADETEEVFQFDENNLNQ